MELQQVANHGDDQLNGSRITIPLHRSQLLAKDSERYSKRPEERRPVQPLRSSLPE